MSQLRWLTVTARTSALRVVAERSGMAVTLGFYMLVVAVLAGLWRVAVDANGGDVAGYGVVAITWYIATTEATTVCLNTRLIADTGRDIGSGAVAVELLRPASVLGIRVTTELGRCLPRLAACAVVGAIVAFVTAGPPPQAAALALAAPSLVLAVTCNIVAQHAFAGIAFWLRDAGSAWFLYQKLVFVLGGMLIPLEALPGWLEGTASVLPFRAMSYASARLAAGHLEPTPAFGAPRQSQLPNVLGHRSVLAGREQIAESVRRTTRRWVSRARVCTHGGFVERARELVTVQRPRPIAVLPLRGPALPSA